ncbi:MAG: hypothetical protein ACRDP6_34135 [Actinoallomurus sp.]
MARHRVLSLAASVLVAGLVAGCGSGASPSSSGSSGTGPATAQGSSQGGGSSTSAQSEAGALVPEAQATAAGDIPDNQVFLVFHDRAGGYSMKYPEGWALSRKHGTETIRDKNNLVRITVRSGSAPSASEVKAEMTALRASEASLRIAGAPQAHPTCTFMSSTRNVSRAAARVDYSTLSAPNQVTGKRVKLIVNRYYLAHAGSVAVLDLGTPQGVDNVDAYCLMATSFQWR